LAKKIFHPDKLVRLDPEDIVREVSALEAGTEADASFPLRLIGMRELRSHNSWMHNVPKLMQGDRVHAARIHPDDARSYGIENGGRCRVISPHGSIELVAKVTDEMSTGTVAIPHGWGHRGRWQQAMAAGGVNVNLLTSSAPQDLERLAGMARLNGIPIRLERVGARPS
jgi:formate dehydrogenase